MMDSSDQEKKPKKTIKRKLTKIIEEDSSDDDVVMVPETNVASSKRQPSKSWILTYIRGFTGHTSLFFLRRKKFIKWLLNSKIKIRTSYSRPSKNKPKIRRSKSQNRRLYLHFLVRKSKNNTAIAFLLQIYMYKPRSF